MSQFLLITFAIVLIKIMELETNITFFSYLERGPWEIIKLDNVLIKNCIIMQSTII